MFEAFNILGADVQKSISGVASSSVRAYLNSLYPNEFEYYLFTLELVNQAGVVEDILIFPVMPNSISEQRTSLINIRKTNNSIVSITNNTFAPTNISISGSFGRKIRILLGQQKSSGGSAFAFSEDFNINKKEIEVNGEIKTGFGVTKMLERIIKKSQSKAGYLLFLYNPSLSNNYLVEVTDMTFSQSMENNMLWNYQIQFKSLAKAEDVYPAGQDKLNQSIKNQLKFDNINKAVFKLTNTINGIRTLINTGLDKIGVL